MTPPALLDLASVAVFALTGALVASRAQLDIVGFLFIACLTAVGGGTVRDLLIGRDPVFWISSPKPILVASAAAVLVFFTAHLLESRYKVLIWLDALALSVAVSAGIAAAKATGQPTLILLLMGITTGCMGGLLRDVVCNEVPLVLKAGELYVTAAFAGALASVVTVELGGTGWAPLVACTVVTFALRAGSIAFGWRLPAYKPRPPKGP
ncbi:trimeric intracellular cation channel family protein [Fluviibacterium sp. DFM31]|uniref:Trimeric intracellular cation channel family protein n=1 Tax=Meridianimarinicoccus marinus TaxID=3231483 RepID=A0ABV3L0W5_9RHOB